MAWITLTITINLTRGKPLCFFSTTEPRTFHEFDKITIEYDENTWVGKVEDIGYINIVKIPEMSDDFKEESKEMMGKLSK